MSRRAAALLAYAIFFVLAAVSWQRWIEPFVDSGRELMAPRRIAGGEALYRDVRFYHGPLAPYLAAGIDIVAGPSLPARIAFAALIALAHLEALRRLASRALSPGRAALATASIVAVAFFLRPGGQLFPFSFDTSLAVAAIAWALVFLAAPPARGSDLAAGACLGAALLCRPEMGIAALLVAAWETRPARRLVSVAIAPAIFGAAVYALVSSGTPLHSLRREGWLAIAGPPDAFRNVYAAYAGFDRPALRLAELALAAIAVALAATLVVAAAFFSRAARGAGRTRVASLIDAAAILLLAGTGAVAYRPPPALAEAVALLPPLVRVVPAVALGAAIVRVRRRLAGRAPEGRQFALPDAVLLLAALFGLRLFLAAGYAGPYNAFLLPLPLLVTAVLLFRAADRFRASAGESLPALVASALLVFLLFRVAVLARAYRHKGWARVDTPAGSLFLQEPVASATRGALDDLATRVRSGGAVAGFPEAGFFHYVLGFSNPLPQEQFFPGHLDETEEEKTIATLAARPPEAVVLCNVIAVGHGSRAFGKDYLVRLARFLRERYAPAGAFGPGARPDAAIGDPQFFIEVRVPRRPAAP